MKTVTVKAQVVVPRVPNFLHMVDGQVIPVEAIATEGLEELGRALVETRVTVGRRSV